MHDFSSRRWVAGNVAIVCLLFLLPAQSGAQQTSVRPGVNDSFKNPNVASFVERFEREGREVYDHRMEIIEVCRLRPGMTVADIGAGTGLFTRLLADRVGPRGNVLAVDIARNFVRHVVQQCNERGLENVRGIVCPADSANLPPESIDLAFICDTYHHFEFPYKTMRSLHRGLRPGGQVLLVEFKRIEGESSDWILGHVRAGQEVFTSEIESCGFRPAGEEKFLKDTYVVRFEKVAATDRARANE